MLDVALSHSFGRFALDAAFKAPKGVTALFGRSGAGKSTIVNAIAGLLTPDRGRITIAGETLLDTDARIAVPVHRRRVGYVFQDGRLFPHLDVRQNLTYGRWFARGLGQGGAEATFDGVVDMLGLAALLSRHPGGLSGGEKQRVAIGRALLSQPRILLMDEPLAALDENRKAEILPYLERLRDDVTLPIVYVSHSIPEIARLATTIVALSEGRVARAGPAAEILADPDSFPILGRQEAGAIIAAKIVGHDAADDLTELSFSGGQLFTPRIDAALGSAVRVRIRARDIMLATDELTGISALNVLPVVVRKVGAEAGPIVDVALRCGQDDLLARITQRSARRLGIAPGKACFAVLKSIAVSRRDISTIDERGD